MTGPNRVLIVDDNAGVVEAVGRVLRRAGYQTVHAIHGRQALNLLRAGLRADVILLDLAMPVMDGNQLLQELPRSPAGHVPVVVLSGYLNRLRYDGAAAVVETLEKPVDAPELLAAIAGAIAAQSVGAA